MNDVYVEVIFPILSIYVEKSMIYVDVSIWGLELKLIVNVWNDSLELVGRTLGPRLFQSCPGRRTMSHDPHGQMEFAPTFIPMARAFPYKKVSFDFCVVSCVCRITCCIGSHGTHCLVALLGR